MNIKTEETQYEICEQYSKLYMDMQNGVDELKELQKELSTENDDSESYLKIKANLYNSGLWIEANYKPSDITTEGNGINGPFKRVYKGPTTETRIVVRYIGNRYFEICLGYKQEVVSTTVILDSDRILKLIKTDVIKQLRQKMFPNGKD